MAYKSRYTPENPGKYNGDFSRIQARSTWERQCMKYFDKHPGVVKWNSEEVVVPYKSPIDGRFHRYFVDFLVTFRKPDNTTETILIEVKPKKQSQAPKVRSRVTKRYLKEVRTWGINNAKWIAAIDYAEERGWRFEVWTERTLKKLGMKIF